MISFNIEIVFTRFQNVAFYSLIFVAIFQIVFYKYLGNTQGIKNVLSE